jgi:hypothetical protein
VRSRSNVVVLSVRRAAQSSLPGSG